MPFNLRLSKTLRKAGWKVKVFDLEGPETPHVTIIAKTRMWRMSLRTGDFLFPGGSRNDLPDELLKAIEAPPNWQAMKEYWDTANPHNPVEGDDDSN